MLKHVIPISNLHLNTLHSTLKDCHKRHKVIKQRLRVSDTMWVSTRVAS